MEINRSSLLAELKKALPGIDNGKSPIQGADAFLFSGNYIHTFNSHIGMSIPTVTEGMNVAVKASEFYKLLTKAGEDIVNMELEDGVIRCKMGRFRSKMSPVVSAVSTYVESLGVSDLAFTDVPEGFCDGLRLCKVADSQLGGILVKENSMIATDGRVSTMYTLPEAMPIVWISDSAIKALLKVGNPVAYCIGASWAHFRYSDGTVFSCSTLVSDRYPHKKLKGLLEQCAFDKTCISGKLPDGIAEAIGRVSIFSATKDGITPINMELNANSVLLFSAKNEGECEEEVPWEEPWAGDAVTCTMDAGVLLECYRKGVGFYIKKVGDSTVLVFTSDNFIQVTEI